MPEPFDPYLTWMDIPLEDRPVNHYRLLGVPLMEEHPDVIEEAADRVIQTLRSLDAGAHTFEQRMLLNKVSAARHCLLNEVLREEYNQKLAQADAATPKSPAPGSTERESQVSEPIETAPIEKAPIETTPRDAEPSREKAAPVPPSPPAAQSPVAPQNPQAPAAASEPQSPPGQIFEVEKPRTTLPRKKRPGLVTRILQFLRLKQK